MINLNLHSRFTLTKSLLTQLQWQKIQPLQVQNINSLVYIHLYGFLPVSFPSPNALPPIAIYQYFKALKKWHVFNKIHYFRVYRMWLMSPLIIISPKLKSCVSEYFEYHISIRHCDSSWGYTKKRHDSSPQGFTCPSSHKLVSAWFIFLFPTELPRASTTCEVLN